MVIVARSTNIMMFKLLLLAITTTTRASAFISPYAKRTVVTRMSATKSDEARDIVIIGKVGMCLFFIFAYVHCNY